MEPTKDDAMDVGLITGNDKFNSKPLVRNGRAITKENLEDVKKKLADKVASKEEKQALQDFLTVVTPSGDKKLADVNNEDDVKMLADQRESDVYKRIEISDAALKKPQDLLLSIDPLLLPPGINKKVFPLIGIEPYMLFHSKTINERQYFLPIVNVPVYTPLLYLLLTGTMRPFVEDSWIVLSTYMAAIRHLLESDLIYTRKSRFIEVMTKKIKEGSLTELDTIAFSKCCQFKKGEPNWTIPIGITLENFEDVMRKVISVKQYDGLGELEEGKMYADNVLSIHFSLTQGWLERVTAILDVLYLNPDLDMVKISDANYRSVIELLNIYESTIMNLYATGGHFDVTLGADYRTPYKRVPCSSVRNNELDNIQENRRKLLIGMQTVAKLELEKGYLDSYELDKSLYISEKDVVVIKGLLGFKIDIDKEVDELISRVEALAKENASSSGKENSISN